MTQPQLKLVINCPPLCSFHPDKIGEEKAEILRALRETGAGSHVWTRHAIEVLGFEFNESNSKRHFKHYRQEAEDSPHVTGAKVPHVQILEEIIQAGFRNSKQFGGATGIFKTCNQDLRYFIFFEFAG